MRNLQTRDLSALVVLCVIPAVLCCRAHHQLFRVEVPASFSGTVDVACDGYGDDLPPVSVNSTGHAKAPVCTRDLVDVLVERDGKPVDVHDSLKWVKTGDGIPVGLTFSVK